ncbi:amidase [Methylobacterium sp. 17Sr1-1]|uniref:amidase n=1 Tax=Methylobacterium sp. 17Sr1-1 TaxID=2202826 RepID=UPI000D704BF5|nr:amidase [Methylobacterium sp. 17Sr1-1]AWN54636.1 Asp-tRNA(Asn)/Glu-tRNA(Gln) amidotransferase GatCAB subunit A [Methylobacterium sp. 17Sr1-1]
MPTPLHDETLLSIAERIRRREVTSLAVTQAQLDRIAALDGLYRSYTTVTRDHALARAERADRETALGISRGPLHGVPVAVKDLCDTTFAPTAAGGTLRRNHVPSADATVVARLEQGGAVILGKLSMTEGAYTSHHPDNPGPLNPWSRDHWVGSSSTGSGAATAARLCYASLGSDTGGSIRFPSATCGLTGLKPTWGRVSRHGIFPLAASLDHVGPMARSAADAAAVLGVIAGADPADPTALQAPVDSYLEAVGRPIRGITVGIDRRFVSEGIDPEVVAALDAVEAALRACGARIREIAFPPTDRLVRGWIPFCSVETALAHQDSYPLHRDAYGPDLAALIDQGRGVTGAELGAIFHERLAFTGALAALFEEVDLILVPTMPVPIPSLSRMSEYGQDPEVLLRILRFTAPFNFSGTPTITLPAGIDAAGLPLSVQLAGRPLSEALLCQAGHAFQQVTDWHARRPPGLP